MAFLVVLLALLIPPIHGSIIQCSSGTTSKCSISNYQGLWIDRDAPCEVASVSYPTTEEELVAAVAGAVQRKQSIKVVSKFAHSIPKLACPRGSSGLVISTSKYNSRITVDDEARTVTVDAGVELGDLFSRLAQHGLTLPVSPSFNGITVVGSISTGAHGSGLSGRGGALHDYVVGMSIVVPAGEKENYARVVRLTTADEDLDAARLSLGVLGAVSQVTFAVEVMFKRSVTKLAKNDSTLGDDILEIAKKYDFGEINWHINQGKTIQTLSSKVPVSTPGEGRSIIYTPRLGSSVAFWRGVAEQEMAAENTSAICALSVSNVPNRVATGDGFVNEGGSFKSYPVVGFNHLMETGGGCQNTSVTKDGDKLTCPWDSDLVGHQVFFETAISIPLSKIKDVVLDIKRIRDENPDKLCILNMFGGTIFRFVKGSTAYLASPHDSFYFDMLFYRDRNANIPTLDMDRREELQQMLIKKYKGRPHWGKNQDAAFENVGKKVTSLEKFLKAMKRMDPEGLFSNEWTDAVLGIQKKGGREISIVRDFCALEGLCVCSKDSHCAPQKGYLCKPGVFFKEARVCRKST